MDEVQTWMLTNGFQKFLESFKRAAIAGSQLLKMDHAMLENHFHILKYGERCELLAAIQKLKEANARKDSIEKFSDSDDVSSLLIPAEALHIGKALMGEVYLRGIEFDEMLHSNFRGTFYGKDATVRVLRSRPVDKKDLRRTLKELKALRHPRLVLFLGAVARPQACCLVSELVVGTSLHTLFERVAAIPSYTVASSLQALLQIAHELAVVMCYLHTRRIWHLNLRPTKIILDSNSSVKISDSSVERFQSCLEVAQCHRLRYASPWTSPEALRSALWADIPRPVLSRDLEDPAATDVYAFGVILWELLAGRRPFRGFSSAQLMLAVGLGRRRLPRLRLSGPAGDLAHTCTRYQPSRRPVFAEVLRLLTPAVSIAKAEATLEAVEAFLG
jgi:serine/threonine protein kinase